jgi:hypothetical protein
MVAGLPVPALAYGSNTNLQVYITDLFLSLLNAATLYYLLRHPDTPRGNSLIIMSAILMIIMFFLPYADGGNPVSPLGGTSNPVAAILNALVGAGGEPTQGAVMGPLMLIALLVPTSLIAGNVMIFKVIPKVLKLL